MAKFTDAQGREWSVFIDIPTVKKLRSHDLDVLNFFSGEMEVFQSVVGDPVRLVDTLWLICESQIEDRGMDEEDFARSLHGDSLMHAAEALVEGICDFFPDPKRRASIRMMFRKTKEAEDILMDGAMLQLETMDAKELAKRLETEYTEKFGESQASSE